MNCGAVRDRLPERALGTLAGTDRQAVDRHLDWCAACRKEAGELDRASATLAFALAPADPEEELRDRIVADVSDAAAKGRPLPRRGRLAVALAVAAMLAISGLGWGAVMAGRVARFRETALEAKRHQADVVQRFSDLLRSPEFNDPGNRVFFGKLAGTRGGVTGGSALTLVSPTTTDVAIVMVNGLRVPDPSHVRFRVLLISERGRALDVGRILSLDAGFGAIVSRQFEVDLSRYTGVEVRDATGAVILSGSVRLRTAITTPSP